jgi:hypothetical protein
MSKKLMRETFEVLRAKKDGPVKKFELLKLFGRALKDAGVEDPRTLSCAEIEAKIAELWKCQSIKHD